MRDLAGLSLLEADRPTRTLALDWLVVLAAVDRRMNRIIEADSSSVQNTRHLYRAWPSSALAAVN